MLRNEVMNLIEALKLRGMQEVYDEVLATGRKQRAIPEKVVLELLKAEAAERRLRSIRYRLGQARFPITKDLDSFRFTESSVDEAQIRSLYEGGFLQDHSKLIFVGGTGTGKTHLAIAIAANLVRQGSRARFYNGWTWPMTSNKRIWPAEAANSPPACHASTWSYSTNWGICRSPRTPASCSFT